MTQTESELRAMGLIDHLELYEDRYIDGDKRLIRIYITSRHFGILAHGEVHEGDENKIEWKPVYPRMEIKSYPIKGNWCSANNWYYQNPNTWKHAVLCALDPTGFNFGKDSIAKTTAKTRIEYRKNLRAEIVKAILRKAI